MTTHDYERVERAIHYLTGNFKRQPTLTEAAREVHLSEFHFQRLFKRWAGISAKRFVQYLTVEYAKQLLDESRSVLDVAYASGLSSPGRLHDLFVTVEAVTPGEYKLEGAGLEIAYGVHPTPFGDAFLAATDRGVCALSFLREGDRSEPLDRLAAGWPGAKLLRKPALTRPLAARIFSGVDPDGAGKLRLHLKGTNFQIKVWEALLRIPPGHLFSYEDVGVAAGFPGAVRAVGQAVARNPIAYVIPCHRVIQKTGGIGGYRWGKERKLALVGWEAARRAGAGA